MWFNSFLAQRLTEERMKDVQREAKQARLARAYRHQRLQEMREREKRRIEGWARLLG